MKKSIALVLAVLCICGLLGCNGKRIADREFHEEGGNLNMATLKSLVEMYGEALTWESFAPYWCYDVGSGLYILDYPVDADYHLLVGGTSPEEPPMYIRLVDREDPDRFIDVRTESIDDFIE